MRDEQGAEEFIETEPDPVVREYNVQGNITTHSESAVCKESDLEGVKTFYIKMSSDKLYDPNSVAVFGTNSLGAKRNGLDVWKYRKVGEEAWGQYMQFLKVRSATYLLRAERLVNQENS